MKGCCPLQHRICHIPSSNCLSPIHMEYILFSILSHSGGTMGSTRTSTETTATAWKIKNKLYPICSQQGTQYKYWLLLLPGQSSACTFPCLHLTLSSGCWEPSNWWQLQQHLGKAGGNRARERELESEICHHLLHPWLQHQGQRQRCGFCFLVWNLIIWGWKESSKILYPQRTSFAVLNHPKDHGVYLHSAIELGQVVIINLQKLEQKRCIYF